MERILLLGANIAHSRSPAFHNRLFEQYHLPYRYELKPTTREELPALIQEMKSGGYRGANVTSPFKEDVAELMDECSEVAGRLGSVNTILFDQGRAEGFNTDVEGVRASLAGNSLVTEEFTAAVLGTGGAARAAVEGLLGFSSLQRLTLYSRSQTRAERTLPRWNDSRLHAASLKDFTPADLVIHATPVGLPGMPGRLLEPEQFRGVRLLFEMIYHPPRTSLMEAAAEAGVPAINGTTMFDEQAMAAFRIWTRGKDGTAAAD